MTTQRWSTGQVVLGVAIPLMLVGLSMKWFGHGGVGFGSLLQGADRAQIAQFIGILGYLTCLPALLTWLDHAVGGRSKRHVASAWVGLMATFIVVLGGIALAADVPSSYPMRPGFPVFCCAGICMIIGLLCCWPPEANRPRDTSLRLS